MSYRLLRRKPHVTDRQADPQPPALDPHAPRRSVPTPTDTATPDPNAADTTTATAAQPTFGHTFGQLRIHDPAAEAVSPDDTRGHPPHALPWSLPRAPIASSGTQLINHITQHRTARDESPTTDTTSGEPTSLTTEAAPGHLPAAASRARFGHSFSAMHGRANDQTKPPSSPTSAQPAKTKAAIPDDDIPPLPSLALAAEAVTTTPDTKTRTQEHVLQANVEAISARSHIVDTLMHSTNQRLPGLAELLEPGPDGTRPAIPNAPTSERTPPAPIDEHARLDAQALLDNLPPQTPTIAPIPPVEPSPRMLSLPSPEPSLLTMTPPLAIQRSARPAATDGAPDDYDPNVARAQVGATAEALLHAAAQAQRTMQVQASTTQATIDASGQQIQQTIQQIITQRVSTCQTRATQRRTALLTAVQTTLGQIDTALQTTISAVIQKGTSTKAELTASFTMQHADIQGKVADALVQAEALRHTRKQEAGQQILLRANAARQRGSATAGSYGGDERGQRQGQAARQVADQGAQAIAAEQPKIEQAVDDATAKLPDEIRTKGQDALRALGQGLPSLLEGVDHQVQATIGLAQRDAQAVKHQVQQLGATLGLRLEAQHQTVLTGLQALVPQATAQLQGMLTTIAPALQTGVSHAGTQVQQFVSQAHGTLLGMTTPDVEKAQQYIDQVVTFAHGAAGDVADTIHQADLPILAQMTQVQHMTDSAAQALETRSSTTLDAITAETHRALGSIMTSTTAQFTGLVSGLDKPFDTIKRHVVTDLSAGIAKLNTSLQTAIGDTDREVLKAIGSGVTKADAALSQLDGKMNEAADEAGWRYDHPVLATLKDIGGFVVGLVVGIAVVLVAAVVVIVMAEVLIAGLVMVGLTMGLATLVVAVTGLALLAGGIYLAYQARVQAGEQSGVLTGLKAFADVIGLTDIYRGFTDPNLTPFERGFGIGRGGASIALIFSGSRLNNLIKARLPASITNPTRGSAWNWMARGPLDVEVPYRPSRPPWRQSESDVTHGLPDDFGSQPSFLDNREVPYGTEGSTRPDNYRPGGFLKPPIAVDVKNYALPRRMSALVRDVVEQSAHRFEMLPNTVQKVIIDVRGQHVSQNVLDAIVTSIVEKSGGTLRAGDIQFLR